MVEVKTTLGCESSDVINIYIYIYITIYIYGCNGNIFDIVYFIYLKMFIVALAREPNELALAG